MSRDPCLRFIGVPASAPPHELLGLDAAERGHAIIQEALRVRLERLYRHPAGRTREAEIARRVLREAAQRLRSLPSPAAVQAPPAARVSAGPPRSGRVAEGHRLTTFDRAVLAALVANGGWNRRSRTMLAAISAQHGVTVDGLVRVLRGLDAHARSGGPAFQLSEIAANVAARASADAAIVERLSEVTRRYVPELAARDSWSLTKLSALVALLVALFSIVIYRAMVVQVDLLPAEQFVGGSAADYVPENAAVVSSTDAAVRLAPFRSYPTFRGNAMPAVGAAQADRSAALVSILDDLERRFAAGDALDEAVLALWSDAIDGLSTGWVLTGPSQMHDHQRRVLRVLAETSGRPDVARRLMQQLVPPPLSILEPIDLWRGAWISGMLAEIGISGMSPYIVELARGQLAASLGRPAVPMLSSFSDGAGLWLEEAGRFMVERIEIDDSAADAWEMWLAVQNRAGPVDRVQGAIVVVIGRILSGTSDLVRTSPTTRLLGRLLMEADFSGHPQVRDAMVGWFEPRPDITDADLWVLTSLLVQGDAAPWIDQTFVLMPSEPITVRLRIGERLRAAWPSRTTAPARASLPPPDVPRDLLDEWGRIAASLHASNDSRSDDGRRALRLQRVAQLMAINAGAEGLLRGDLAGAQRMLQLAESRIVESESVGDAGASLLTPGSYDGEWASRYGGARGTDERRMLVEELQDRRGSDFGPVDAALLAELIFRGPASIRAAARRVYLSGLSDAPAVVLALIDHFHLLRPDDRDFREVVAQATGSPAIMAAGDDAYFAMRQALVEQLVGLLDAEVPELERSGQVMAEILGYHVAMTDGTRLLELGMTDVFEGIARLSEAQVRRMERRAPGERLLDTVPIIRRSRAARLSLAVTPMEVLAAEQITVLQCTAFEAKLVRSHRAADIDAVLDAAAGERREATDLMKQMMTTQRAVLKIMEIRLAVDEVSRRQAREVPS